MMNQAMGYARQVCARVFRDGGSPADALEAFGLRLPASEAGALTWDKFTVERVAEVLCAKPMQRAA